MQIMTIGTAGGRTYAIMLDTTAGDREKPGIDMSGDGLRSWRVIRPSDLAANDTFFDFWLDPASGTLAAPTYGGTLWLLSGGVRWTRITTPSGQTSVGAWLPQRQQWIFCGEGNVCSRDLGATWTSTPALSDTFTCANCGKNGAPESNTVACGPAMIAAGGSYLTVCGQTTPALYILPHNSTAWTNLGPAPCIFDHITATNHVWCFLLSGGVDELAIASLPAYA
jgi:hypothetical protein